MVNADQLRAIRKRVAPDLSQAEFARSLGYADPRNYRRYENGTKNVPVLLGRLAEILDMYGLPDGWRKTE